MIHFMGWYWPLEDHGAAARASDQRLRLQKTDPRWQPILNADGVLVMALRGRHDRPPVVLAGDAGVIVGSIFQGAKPVPNDPRDDISIRILASRAEVLVREYWGNYVAIVRARTGCLTLLRGPASTVPVLRDCDGKIQRFFSSVEISAAINLITPNMDWPVVACSLMGPVASSRTAIKGLYELLPGYAEHLSPGGTGSEDMWKPLSLARRAAIADSTEAAKAIRATIQSCTRAYAAGHQRVLHGLSGGLDSSVVLATLNAIPEQPETVCVTYYSEDLEGDERIPARESMRNTRARLIERLRREDVDLTRALGGARTARPPGLRMPEVDRSEVDLADEIDATVLMKGHGGDELFCRNLAIPAAADCLRQAPRGFLSLALHAAVTEGVTIWQILANAICAACLPKRAGPMRVSLSEQDAPPLLSPEVVNLVLGDPSFGEASLTWPYSCPPGKRLQLALATGPRFYGTPHSRIDDVNLCIPILSQPVIEAALRIPTWLQFENRGERAVLRNAFADLLSPETLRRRTKGGAEFLARRILKRNMTFVRELLLDGILVRERMIDRPRLSAALSQQPAAAPLATGPIFSLLGTEIWLRRWLKT